MYDTIPLVSPKCHTDFIPSTAKQDALRHPEINIDISVNLSSAADGREGLLGADGI